MTTTKISPPPLPLLSTSDLYLFIEIDLAGNIVYLNPTLTRLLSGGNLIGEQISNIIHPQDIPTFEICLLKLTQNSIQSVSAEINIKIKENIFEKIKWEFFRNERPDNQDRIIAIGHQLPQISAQNPPDSAPGLHERLIKSILSSHAEAALIVDSHHRVVVMNEAAEQLIGRITGRAVQPGFSLYSVLESPIREQYENMNNHVQVHGCFAQELEIKSHDAQIFSFLIKAHRLSTSVQLAEGVMISLELPSPKYTHELPANSIHELIQQPMIRPIDLKKPATEILSIIAALNADDPCDPMNAVLIRRLENYATLIDHVLSDDPS